MPKPMPMLRLGGSGGLLSSQIVAQLPWACLDTMYRQVLDLPYWKTNGFPRNDFKMNTTKSKKVGNVIVTICLTEDEGLCIADGGKWLLMCETHGFIVQDTNKARLWSNANEVIDWCDGCKNELAVA